MRHASSCDGGITTKDVAPVCTCGAQEQEAGIAQPEESPDARDERIADYLRKAIAQRREMAAELRREAREMEALAMMWEQAASKQEWWKLNGVLGSEDVESLCEVSPLDLLGA